MVIPANDEKTICYRVYVEFIYHYICSSVFKNEAKLYAVYWRKGPFVVVKYMDEIVAELEVGKKFHSTQGRDIYRFFSALDVIMEKNVGYSGGKD